MSQPQWTRYYQDKQQPALYPEGFVVRAFLSGFPAPMLVDRDFAGRKALDMSCGYGRNLGLLLDLGLEVHATEVDPEVVARGAARFPSVSFAVGRNGDLPHPDGAFDFVLACNSCYYLAPGAVLADNLAEVARILRPGGSFVGSLPGPEHFVFDGGHNLPDGSVRITGDRDGLRDGDRLQRADSDAAVRSHLAPWFRDVRTGRLRDECGGLTRDLFYFTGVRTEVSG
jgi:SAM-dependent methyltransferase